MNKSIIYIFLFGIISHVNGQNLNIGDRLLKKIVSDNQDFLGQKDYAPIIYCLGCGQNSRIIELNSVIIKIIDDVSCRKELKRFRKDFFAIRLQDVFLDTKTLSLSYSIGFVKYESCNKKVCLIAEFAEKKITMMAGEFHD